MTCMHVLTVRKPSICIEAAGVFAVSFSDSSLSSLNASVASAEQIDRRDLLCEVGFYQSCSWDYLHP